MYISEKGLFFSTNTCTIINKLKKYSKQTTFTYNSHFYILIIIVGTALNYQLLSYW